MYLFCHKQRISLEQIFSTLAAGCDAVTFTRFTGRSKSSAKNLVFA